MSAPLPTPPGHLPAALYDPENAPLLTGILRGVEKESLRVGSDGLIATTDHPPGLGSALTHPQITTDFSEALLEFITPPSHRVSALLQQLHALHQYTCRRLPAGELLWNHSMPCMIGTDADIPVARYGTTNRGRMKTVYRVGLGHRYGRVMQTVAGVHYNFSLPKSFWAFLHQQEDSVEELDDYITRRYFDLIRNFRRHYWLLIYLFGASPAVCRSFVKGRDHRLQVFNGDDHTLHLPYATSLRMGDLGYQSKAQESLYVCYNSLNSYIHTLGQAISTPYPPYEALGLRDPDGSYRQLNTGLLQIENEFYSAIRPKRTAQKGETALTALCQRGVEYVEVRCLDIDPFSPTGINAHQIRFLDAFLLFCALEPSPPCDPAEFQRTIANQKAVVQRGRDPAVTLTTPDGETAPLRDWAERLMAALTPLAQLLDVAHGGQRYSDALAAQQTKVQDPEQTPSAQVLRQLRDSQLTFHQWARHLARQHQEALIAQPLPDELAHRLADMADESLALQAKEERRQQKPFGDYLHDYYTQYRACCDSTRAPCPDDTRGQQP